MKLILSTGICILCSVVTFGQITWQTAIPDLSQRQIEPSSSEVYSTDFTDLKNYLSLAPKEGKVKIQNSNFLINIPIDGEEVLFRIVETDVMHPDLAKKFPNIKTFVGNEVNGSGYIRLDHTQNGFHAWIKRNGKTIFIDPQCSSSLNE